MIAEHSKEVSDVHLMDDMALARLAAQSNSTAFAELYNRHKGNVYRLCIKVLKNESDAEDITQEVFLQVQKKIALFRGDAKFSTWLHRLTLNQIFMHLRSEKRRFTVKNCEMLDANGSIHIEDNGEEILHTIADPFTIQMEETLTDRITLEKIINKLPKGYKKVFILKESDGFLANEVGKQINCTEGTVKSQLWKAKRKLRKLLKSKRRVLN